jgi:hypothetical protein
LIGVKEAKGGPSEVVGIPTGDQLDDHSLQQFVCGKTNRPVPFSYARFLVDDREIGVITIPVPDQRPFYLRSEREFDREGILGGFHDSAHGDKFEVADGKPLGLE